MGNTDFFFLQTMAGDFEILNTWNHFNNLKKSMQFTFYLSLFRKYYSINIHLPYFDESNIYIQVQSNNHWYRSHSVVLKEK